MKNRKMILKCKYNDLRNDIVYYSNHWMNEMRDRHVCEEFVHECRENSPVAHAMEVRLIWEVFNRFYFTMVVKWVYKI